MAREKKLSIIRISGCEKWEIMKSCVNIHESQRSAIQKPK